MFKGFAWIIAALALLICVAAVATREKRPFASSHEPIKSASLYDFDVILPEGHELRVLEEAASKGDLSARLTLAKRFVEGDGVKKSEARAFAYFESIANQYPDIDPMEPRAAYISEAFRHLASLYRKGIPAIDLKPSRAQANGLLHHSASYFGDPVSQFELAKLLLSDEGSERNTRIAVGWLLNASRKGHAPAQAMLGDMLWRGEQVKRAAGDGLGLLAVARENSSKGDSGWISALFLAARNKATEEDIEIAHRFIVQNGGFLRNSAMLGQAFSPEVLLASDGASVAAYPAANEAMARPDSEEQGDNSAPGSKPAPPRDGSTLAVPRGGAMAMPVSVPSPGPRSEPEEEEAMPVLARGAAAKREAKGELEVAGALNRAEPQ